MLKTKTERLLALAIAFLAGCVTRVVVPAAHAGQAVQRWEYACMGAQQMVWPAEDIASKANAFGKEGWEMAAAGGGGGASEVWCFKRALGATTTPVSAQ
jgi:hypothetical protein